MIANSLQLLENETSHFQAPFIATKWWPLGRNATSLNKSIETRLNCLERRPITLYQIHHPTSFSSIERQMEAMALLVRSNKIKYVGVSNFSASQLRKAHTALKKFNIELVSNQVRYNLFDRSIEHNGILTTAKELGISIIAYSPLHQGLLTGKFHDDPRLLNQLFFLRKFQYRLSLKTLKETQPLIDNLQRIGKKYDKSASQIALNWLIHFNSSMVFAIPGASKPQHVKENVEAMTFQLSQDELTLLDKISQEIQN